MQGVVQSRSQYGRALVGAGRITQQGMGCCFRHTLISRFCFLFCSTLVTRWEYSINFIASDSKYNRLARTASSRNNIGDHLVHACRNNPVLGPWRTHHPRVGNFQTRAVSPLGIRYPVYPDIK